MVASKTDSDKKLSGEEGKRVRAKLRAEAFAFATRVAPLYVLLSWRWEDKSRPYIPDRKVIEKTLLELVRNMPAKGGSNSTGGLSVWVEKRGVDDIECGFTFEVEEAWYL